MDMRADLNERFVFQGILLTWLKLFVHGTLWGWDAEREDVRVWLAEPPSLAPSNVLQILQVRKCSFISVWIYWVNKSHSVSIIIANMKMIMIECSSGVFNHHKSKKWSHWMNYWSELWELIIRLWAGTDGRLWRAESWASDRVGVCLVTQLASPPAAAAASCHKLSRRLGPGICQLTGARYRTHSRGARNGEISAVRASVWKWHHWQDFVLTETKTENRDCD